MASDTTGGGPRGIPLRAMCPQCHNPHTIVAEQRYRDMLRFCPMCDHSWVVSQVIREKDVQSKGRQDAGPKKFEKLAAKR